MSVTPVVLLAVALMLQSTRILNSKPERRHLQKQHQKTTVCNMPRCTTIYSASLINENVRSQFGKTCGFVHPLIFTAVNSRRRKVQNRKKISGHSWEGRTADCFAGANKSCGTTKHNITIPVTLDQRQRIFADVQNNQMTANRKKSQDV
jgi:hypothetical protein